MIEHHVHIRALERKIRMFESRGNNNLKLVEAIRRSGQTLAKNVQHEFKVLEEAAREVDKVKIDSSLPNNNNNVEGQTDLLRNKVVTSKDCSSGNYGRVGVKRSVGQDSRSSEERGNEGMEKPTSKIRKIDN